MSNNSLKGVGKYLLIGVSSIIILVSIFVSVTKFRSIMAVRDEITVKETLSTQYAKKIEILTSQSTPQLEEAMTNSLLAIPSTYDSPNLLNALEKIALASDVEFAGLQFGQTSSTNKSSASKSIVSAAVDGVSQYGFSLSTNTDYAHVVGLLKNFENTMPLFDVTNVNLRTSSDASGDLSLGFSVTTYFKELPSSLGERSAPVSGLTSAEEGILNQLENYNTYKLVPDTSNVGKQNPFN